MINIFMRAGSSIYPGSSSREMRNKARFLFRAMLHVGDYRHFANRMVALEKFESRARSSRLVGLVEWPYINCDWDVRHRFDVVATHYEMLAVSGCALGQVEDEVPMRLADLGFVTHGASIVVDRAPWFIREGELVLNLFIEELRVASLAFALGGTDTERKIYAGAIQGIHSGVGSEESLATFKRLTKAFEGIRPRTLLIEVLRAIAVSLGADTIHAVADANRHHRHTYFGYDRTDKFKTDYDQIWVEHGGVLAAPSGFWLLDTSRCCCKKAACRGAVEQTCHVSASL